MIEYTKPLSIKNKIKKGVVVPKDAIELCSFDNNVNKNKSANKISSSAEKNLSQAKLGRIWKVVKDLETPDDSHFPSETEYKDETGYEGLIKLKDVEWIERIRHFKKYHSIVQTNQYNSHLDVPKHIDTEVEGFSGRLFLTDIKTVEKLTSSTDVNAGTDHVIASKTMTSDLNNFPDMLPFEKHGYVGTLKLIGVAKVAEHNDFATGKHQITVEPVNGSFPSFVEQGGNIYYPTGEYVDKVAEHWVKHYGICRYWGGGGSSSSNNYYGDMDYRYTVHGCAKAFMSDATPCQLLHRWGHWIDKVVEHKPEKYPIDIGGFWDKRYGEHSGIKWTYDIEAAIPYGGLNRSDWGGIIWASEYWKRSGGVWPPKGYEKDYYGDSHPPAPHPGSNASINHNAISFCTKAGPQRTNQAGFYNNAGWYNKWFRDVVVFYKGLTTKKVSHAIFEATTVKPNGISVYYKAIYVGDVFRDAKGQEESITGYVLESTYEGILNKTVITYDGKGRYEGLVHKKVFVDPTITPDFNKMICVVDSDGYLSIENKNNKFTSQFLQLTNISKNGIPMLYTNKIKRKLYLPNGPENTTILDCSYVGLKYDTYATKHIDYLVKLTPHEPNYYFIEVLTHKPIGVSDNVYAYFATYNNEIASEQLSSELIYNQGIDFKSEKAGALHYKFKFGNSQTKVDNRQKLTFSYRVKTTDDSYKSDIITTKLLNKEYALESERISFLGDKMLVSPIVGGETLTAKELVAKFNSIDLSELKDKKFVVEITSDYTHSIDPYTDIKGNGYVYASTYEDTGYPVDVNGVTENTGKEKDFYIASSIDNIIYNGFYVILKNQEGMSIEEPYNSNEMKNWYTRIKFYPFSLASSRNNTNILSEYCFNEYANDVYHPTLEMPYKRIKEVPIILNEHSVKMSRSNILFVSNASLNLNKAYFRLYNKDTGKDYTILGFDIISSIVTTKEVIPSHAKIECDYAYAELTYEYKGYAKEEKFLHMDLNPSVYHTYTRLDDFTDDRSYNLFNNTIYIFVKPSFVENKTTGHIIVDNRNEKYTMYHQINDPNPNHMYDLLIGIISPMPLSSMLNTTLTPTKIIGGGLKEKYIDINRDMLTGFFDITAYNEKAIQKNGTLVVKVDKALSELCTDDKILEILDNHIAIGILPIIMH